MGKLFLLLLIGAAPPAVAQTSKEFLFVIGANYLKQEPTYGQLGSHFNYYDNYNIALPAGVTGNFRSENKQLIATSEVQFSTWMGADNERGGFADILVLLLRPQLNFPPYYFAPGAGIQILTLYAKTGYAFPWGKTNNNYPFQAGKFRFSAGISIPIKQREEKLVLSQKECTFATKQ